MASHLPLKLFLQLTHMPAVLDLEDSVPFDIVLQVRRGSSDLTRPMNILIDESLFDIPFAFSNGLLKISDLGSKEQIDVRHLEASSISSGKPRILTIPPRNSPRLRWFECDLAIPLQLNTHFRSSLLPNHQYRVELVTSDINIKWWSYGDIKDIELQASNASLPPSEPAKLVTSKPTYTQKSFSVVNSLPQPPDISIFLSLASSIVHRSEFASMTLRVVVTSKDNRTITLRSSGDQVYIQSLEETLDIPNHRRFTSLRNFSITKISTGKESVAGPKHICSLTSGSAGHSRRGLITLEPGVPLTYEFALLQDATAVVKAMGEDDDDFCLRLRPSAVWWCEGSIDEIFDGQPTVKKLPGPCLPLILRSDDELRFRLEQ